MLIKLKERKFHQPKSIRMTQKTTLKNIDRTYDNEMDLITISDLDDTKVNSSSMIFGMNYTSTLATGSVRSSKQNSGRNNLQNDLPDEETQIIESLDNLEKGKYEDFSLEDYIKDIDN
jgi:hypothetical protein